MARISLKSSRSPFSVFGGVESGSFRVFQLTQVVSTRLLEEVERLQFRISIEVVNLSYSVDKEIMLVHINLYTRRSPIEILKSLGTMLRDGSSKLLQVQERSTISYMHHL